MYSPKIIATIDIIKPIIVRIFKGAAVKFVIAFIASLDLYEKPIFDSPDTLLFILQVTYLILKPNHLINAG